MLGQACDQLVVGTLNVFAKEMGTFTSWAKKLTAQKGAAMVVEKTSELQGLNGGEVGGLVCGQCRNLLQTQDAMLKET